MFKKILVALDGSPEAEVALDSARFLAQSEAARVELLRVREIPDHLGYPLGFPVAPEVISAEQDACTRYLTARAAELEQQGVSARWRVMAPGDVALSITEAAEKDAADLIILTSHGRTGLGHALMGSVAEKVARHSPCPVMILRRAAP